MCFLESSEIAIFTKNDTNMTGNLFAGYINKKSIQQHDPRSVKGIIDLKILQFIL